MTQAVLFNFLGVMGSAMIIGAYLLLQAGKIRANGVFFLTFNILGSFAILSSLKVAWSWSLLIMQSSWLLITCYGVYRTCVHIKRR